MGQLAPYQNSHFLNSKMMQHEKTQEASLLGVISNSWALLLGMVFIMLGNGLQTSRLSVLVSMEDFGTTVTGTRGKLFSFYMLMSFMGLGGGQILLNLSPPSGFELFLVVSLLISLAVIPNPIKDVCCFMGTFILGGFLFQ